MILRAKRDRPHAQPQPRSGLANPQRTRVRRPEPSITNGAAREPASEAERGYVTAETALVLPSLVGIGLALTVVVAAAADRIRCADAAWEAARLVARGEPEAEAAASAERLAPGAATIRFFPGGGAVTARVSMRLSPIGRLLPALTIAASARIACEEGDPCGADPSARGSAEPCHRAAAADPGDPGEPGDSGDPGDPTCDGAAP